MCRLLGLHAGTETVSASFWLLDAPDSLVEQSRLNPDGFGIGTFDPSGAPVVSKQPVSAWQDDAFARAAHELRGTTFVAHVRHASTGRLDLANTHPFLQDGRLFAHNGVVQGLDELDRRLADLGAADLVEGDTDSERALALITAEIRRHGGDVGAGLRAGVAWMGEHLPVYSLNLILTTPTDLWALRHPAANELHLLPRPSGGTVTGPDRPLLGRGSELSVRSEPLADCASVIVASERLDGDEGWVPVEPGELVHIDASLTIHRSTPFADLARPLSSDDLSQAAAASQRVRARVGRANEHGSAARPPQRGRQLALRHTLIRPSGADQPPFGGTG